MAPQIGNPDSITPEVHDFFNIIFLHPLLQLLFPQSLMYDLCSYNNTIYN